MKLDDRWPDDAKAAALRLRGEGKTYSEIGHAIGMPGKRVGDWLRRHRFDAIEEQKRALSRPGGDGGDFIRPPSLAQLMAGR